MADSIRIANAGGYWGDDLAQFKRQLELGPVDYVTLDFLAEITMSIMQKQRSRDPRAGYARDFIAQVRETLPLLVREDDEAGVGNAGEELGRRVARTVVDHHELEIVERLAKNTLHGQAQVTLRVVRGHDH